MELVNVSGSVIIKKSELGTDLLLLIQRSKKDHWPFVWEFPRGKCDKGDEDNLKSCLKREVKEEVGIDVDVIKYIDKYEYIADGGNRKSTQYNFLCKMKNPNQEIKLSKEHDSYRWIQSVGEAELLVPAEMKKTISKVFNADDSMVEYEDKAEGEKILEGYLKYLQKVR